MLWKGRKNYYGQSFQECCKPVWNSPVKIAYLGRIIIKRESLSELCFSVTPCASFFMGRNSISNTPRSKFIRLNWPSHNILCVSCTIKAASWTQTVNTANHPICVMPTYPCNILLNFYKYPCKSHLLKEIITVEVFSIIYLRNWTIQSSL